MSMKPGFLIYFSICFIGNIFCDNFSPINPAPYVPHKQYYLSGPTEKVDLVDATAKCLAMKMTLATVDDKQDQEILLDQLSKDYSKYGTFGPSEFWLVGPNGLNELKPVPRSAVPHPPGYTLLAQPYSGSRKCVKLAFAPSNVRWANDGCQEKHRFICTESTYSVRSAASDSLTNAMNLVCTVVKLILSIYNDKLVKTKAYTDAEVSKLMEIIIKAPPPPGSVDMIRTCEELDKGQSPSSQLLHKVEIHEQRILMLLGLLTMASGFTIKTNMETIIQNIQKELHWSQEKAKDAVDLLRKTFNAAP